MEDGGSRIEDRGSSIAAQLALLSILDSRFSILDLGFSILDPRFSAGDHTSTISSGLGTSTSGGTGLGLSRHRPMPSPYRPHRVRAISSMLIGSGDNVTTAAITWITNRAIRHLLRYVSTVITPMRSRKSITSGSWKASPTTTGKRMAKL